VADFRDYREFLPQAGLQNLIDTLSRTGYQCFGPVAKDGAIVYEAIDKVSQLPWGATDDQHPGRYVLHERSLHYSSDSNLDQETATKAVATDVTAIKDDPNNDNNYYNRCFAWSNGPQNLKPIVFPSREKIWSVIKNPEGTLYFEPSQACAKPVAVLGVRACDVAALELMDKHYLRADNPDPLYQAHRNNLFLIGINCSHPAATCFCVSTGDGPQVEGGVDIILSELDEGFLLKTETDAGRAIVAQLPVQESMSSQWNKATEELEKAAAKQQRKIPLRNLHTYLMAKLEHPRWSDVAGRCLACGNCTMVCPTCFCHNQVEEPALNGNASDHYRQWDSCFTQGHSYIHGITIREDIAPRYRQWLTHKFGTWHVQYGRSGCVGCGRCITWCPVGIDVTEELAALTAGVVSE